ncbi:hypothetical protein F5984_23810 [Rudanella paleaurantiibacter]|uniref:Lipocalin-like domain-containing protein n=1 Tax=Rudanella paleaurantiibacter TaxID=2614655 RepID=A0A7J5TSZ9_9BACT|nr:hypothetical protein [Rudanella paleaurantiibacter]KAB7726657.1 hypothetical protein F5984_23810 [Rudanella paleaurantiibacter]
MKTLLSIKFRQKAYIGLLALAIPFSCSRNSDISPASIAGQYRVSTITADPGFALGPPFGTVTDVAAFYQQLTGTTCLRDITLSLNADGSAGIDNPATCRSVGDAGPLAGFGGARWAVNDGKLTLTAPNGTSTDYALTRDETTLRLTRQQPIAGSSSSSTVTTVLKRS